MIAPPASCARPWRRTPDCADVPAAGAAAPARRVPVLHLIHHLDYGGAERLVAELLPRLDATRYACHAACLLWRGPLARALEAAGVPVWLVGKRGRFDVAALWRLTQMLRRRHIAILHTHAFSAGLWGRLAAALARTPVVVATVHAVPGWGNRRKHYLADRVFARRTARFVAVSGCVRTALIERHGVPPGRVQVIHNGLDLQRFAPGRDASGWRLQCGAGPQDALLALVGRCREEKGGPLFLEAMGRLVAAGRRVHGVVVGDGPQRQPWEKLARALGLGPHVTFVGGQADPEFWMAAADVVVCPSLQEAFGLVAAEAQALGVPVVATRVGGLQDVVRDGETGLLVPAGDAEALAGAIARLLDAPDMARRMSEAGVRHVHERFSIESTVRGYDGLYQQLLLEAGRGGFP